MIVSYGVELHAALANSFKRNIHFHVYTSAAIDTAEHYAYHKRLRGVPELYQPACVRIMPAASVELCAADYELLAM
jgi:hypothetical protein